MAFGFPAYHTETVTATARKGDLYEAACHTLEALGWPIQQESKNSLSASVGVNFWSWGERITIQFARGGSVTITSSCALPTQCLDWGKNQTNVATFIAEFRKAVRLGELIEPDEDAD